MLPANTTIHNRYQIVRMVGAGGMGAIYEATDLRLRTTVALKQMLAASEAAAQAFVQEAQILAGLRHPALPKVIDHFSDQHGQFLVMEYIPGDDLGALLEKRGGAFPVEHTIAWGEQILVALAYLHSQHPPVVHRDIKPQNLKLTPTGEIVLLDFGLAKGAVGSQKGTTAGRSFFAYTLQYAPPEQLRGEPTGPRSDLYALGATLYALLTGEPPVDAMTRMSNLATRRRDPQPGAHQVNPRVPASVGAVVLRAMALDPQERYGGAAQMRAALRVAAAGGPVTNAPTTRKLATKRPQRQNSLPAWVLPVGLGSAGLVILLFIALTLAFANSTPSTKPTVRATGSSRVQTTTQTSAPVSRPSEARPPTSTPIIGSQIAEPPEPATDDEPPPEAPASLPGSSTRRTSTSIPRAPTTTPVPPTRTAARSGPTRAAPAVRPLPPTSVPPTAVPEAPTVVPLPPATLPPSAIFPSLVPRVPTQDPGNGRDNGDEDEEENNQQPPDRYPNP